MTYLIDALYLLFVILSSPWWLYRMVTHPEWRPHFWQRWGRGLSDLKSEHPVIWIHCCSVGEARVIAPLLKALQDQYPQKSVWVSTLTPSGGDVVKTQYPEVNFFYLPFDFSFLMRRLFRHLKPELILLVESELWPQMLQAAQNNAVPVAVVNGRMTERSFKRMRWFQGLSRSLLSSLKAVVARYPEDAERFQRSGVLPERIHVGGNLKYDYGDQAPTLAAESQDFLQAWRESARLILVAGSTHEGEEAMLLQAWQNLKKDQPAWALILVPRHRPRWEAVASYLASQEHGWSKRSASALKIDDDIILWDTIGELGALYGVADIAFVGGSLVPVGGHNLLEPAQHARPCLFGPYVNEQQEEASWLLAKGGGVQVKDQNALETVWQQWSADPSQRESVGQNGQSLLEELQGATAKHMTVITALLSSE